MPRRIFIGASIAFFALIWLLLLPSRAGMPHDLAFTGDAYDYNRGAIHIVQEGMYSLDGVTPTMEREPGQSTFLAGIYTFFGLENISAIYAVQGVLFLLASLLFVREMERTTSSKIAATTLILLISAPSIWHTTFSAYRESFTLSQLLLFSALALSFFREKKFWKALLLGPLLGTIFLTYYPFVLFPFFFAALLFLQKVKKEQIAVILCIPLLLGILWGARNFQTFGAFRVAGTFRQAAMWYARGQQAEHLRGFDAFRCLLAEYITRDWAGLPDACSTNHLINTMWPNRIPRGDEYLIVKEAQQKILVNLPHHLVFTTFEVLELHLPFVNGWGFIYNVLTAFFSIILYIGVLLGLPHAIRNFQTYGLFLLPALYATGIFSLTDATPRYLMPVIFCYAALAGMGYTRLLQRLRSASP